MFLDPATGEMKGGVVKTSYTHEAMAELILANPAISQGELARHFGYSEGWVSQVISSDAFQAFLGDKKDKIVDPLLRGAIEESFKGLVMQSISRLREKLSANPSDQLVMDVFKNSARALGYGARVQVDVKHTHSLLAVLSDLPQQPREINPISPAPVLEHAG